MVFRQLGGYGVAKGEQSVWLSSYHHESPEMSVFERWNEAATPFDLPLVPQTAEGMTSLATFGHLTELERVPREQIPMYWWPEGHDWVLGQALYGRSVYLACSNVIAEEVLATEGLEAIEVSLSDEAE